MTVKTRAEYTDKETGRLVLAGEHLIVKRQRGLELIASGVALKISDDDYLHNNIWLWDGYQSARHAAIEATKHDPKETYVPPVESVSASETSVEPEPATKKAKK
jgi:hypothetical protein